MRRAFEDDDDEEDEDWDEDGDDDEPTIACPYCQRQIHEDSQRCPYCEKYLSDEESPASQKPWWIIAGALLSLYVVYRWIVG
jgi:hypothetical protein